MDQGVRTLQRTAKNKRKLAEEQAAFERLWDEIREHEALPEMAILNMAEALSRETKGRISNLDYDKAVLILKEVIEEINSGAIETIDQLVKRRL